MSNFVCFIFAQFDFSVKKVKKKEEDMSQFEAAQSTLLKSNNLF